MLKEKNSNPFEKFTFGLGQINPTVGDFKGNRLKICNFIEEGEQQNLDWLIFPEQSICGYPVWDLATKSSFVQAGLASLQDIVEFTRGKKIRVVLGFIDLAPGQAKKNYNALAIIQNGKILHRQYKTLLPTYDVFLEQIFFTPGKEHNVLSVDGVTFGALICEDIWDEQYAIKPAKILTEKGAEILINISASPYHQDALSARREVVLSKAREYGVWVIYVNQVGGQDDLIFDGRSFVCDPEGQIRYQAEAFREGLFKVSLSHLGTGPSKTGTCPSSEFSRSSDATKDIYDALVLGLGDYIRKNQFKKVVIGLSGGIDSALVAALARDALGAESVIGVALPGPFSSPQSLRDAGTLAGNLGIEFRQKSIVAAYENFMAHAVKDGKVSVAMENLQARFRGLELMYISNDEGALLLTTGNKSELAMGYSTLYGDMCGGLAVIGDVYKTDVYRLCVYRNSVSKVIPDAILDRPPTAELRPNQKDQDTLPPYPVLDLILCLYIEKNLSYDEILKQAEKKKISAETVRQVLSSVDHNEYKRRQLPPCLRITEKAWFGRRMPITNLFCE